MHFSRFIIAAVLFACAANARAQGPRPSAPPPIPWPECTSGQVQVLIVGTFHMADREDVVDVLEPQRQQQLEDLAGRLAAWRPDRVAVERPFTSSAALNQQYRAYLDGASPTSRSEVVQLGFRIARKAGVPSVDPIDYRMNLGNDSLTAFYARHPDARERVMAAHRLGDRDSVENEILRRSTLAEFIRYKNEHAHLENPTFFTEIVTLGEDHNFAGAEMLGTWYQRNLRIVHNLIRVSDAEDERILLLIGNGHTGILAHLLRQAPRFCPVSVLDVL